MIIRKIDIERFGTLSDRHETFEDGLNIVRGVIAKDAETLQAFAEAALFGLTAAQYEQYLPEDLSAVYGGTLTVLSDQAEFVIERDFRKDRERFRVVRVSDNAVAAYPDLWIAEAVGHVQQEDFAAASLIRKTDFDLEREAFSGDSEEQQKIREAEDLKKQYTAVRAEFTAACMALDGKIDWNARADYDRSLEEIKALKERQLKIREECPEKEKALLFLQQETEAVEQQTDAEERALQDEEKKAQEAFDDFVRKMKKKAQAGSKAGTVLIFLGLLFFAVTWFYVVSVLNQKVPADRTVCVIAAAGASGLLVLSGLIAAIVSAVKIRKAAGIADRDTPERQARDLAAEALSDYRTRKKEMLDAMENDPERLKKIALMTEEIEALKQEIREGTSRYSALYQKIEALRERMKAQLPYENEYRALDCANGTFDKLIAEAEEAKKIQLALSNDALTEVALSVRLSKLSDVDPQKKLPLIAGDVLHGMSEKRKAVVLQDRLSHEGRQVILFEEA